MHPHIKKLHHTCSKPERLIIGLMSGTSLDGLDIALCRIRGFGTQTTCELIAFTTKEYCETYQQKVRSVFAKHHGSIEQLCLLNSWIALYHAKLVNQAIVEFGFKNQDIDVIASHGQTVYHCPFEQHKLPEYSNATLQIGDGDHLAVHTGITTLSDFRQKHIAAGGQGAPLVMYGDYLLFQSTEESRIMLNIGGIANFSYLPQNGDLSSMFSSDVGPGNTMMDAYTQANFNGMMYDKDAKIATAGKVHKGLLSSLLSSSTHDFFAQPLPKTTGPEVFNLTYLQEAMDLADCPALAKEDVMATLCEFSAVCMVDSILHIANRQNRLGIYISGGGIHNPLLLRRIKQLLLAELPHAHIDSTLKLAINPDAKEAILFALLANETLCSDGNSFNNASANMPNISMGKISFAD